MKPDLPRAAVSGAPHASVGAANYYELAKAHIRTSGRLVGDVRVGFVVKERETPAQWRAWLAYFAWLDDETVPRGRKAETFRSMRNGATVPTEWPLEFDLSAPNPPLYIPDPPVSPARRKELADRLRGIVAGWESPGAPTYRGAPDARHVLDARTAPTPELRAQAVAYHEKRLAELARIYAASDDDARRQQDIV